MEKIFLAVYDWFEKRRAALYLMMAVFTAVCAMLGFRIRFEENISSFFDDGKDESSTTEIFDNFKFKDRIAVVVSGDDPDRMIEAADRFSENVRPLLEEGLIKSLAGTVDPSTISAAADFIYDRLPIFLTASDYSGIKEKISEDGIRKAVDACYSLLTSPSGFLVGEVVKKDPLNIGAPLLKKFQRFSPELDYEIYSGHVFSKDLSTLLLYIEPANGMADTGSNEILVEGLEKAVALSETETVEINCIGGPIVAVHNARRIKKDTALTLCIALLILLPVLLLSFKRKRFLLLIFVPPLLGALFSLALVFLIKGTISAIAIGAGSIVLGISLSYSIHILSHGNYVEDPRQVIADLAYPLTVGCFTTIGAFAALMFTNSSLLQDMGLFASLALVGTILVSLVFIPHFMGGGRPAGKSRLFALIERGNGYSFDDNKWILLSIFAVTAVCLFYFHDVQFDSDMAHINDMPEEVVKAEKRLHEKFGDTDRYIYVVSSDRDREKSYERYARLNDRYDSLKAAGRLEDYISVLDLYIPESEQIERIARWEAFWRENREETLRLFSRCSVEKGFRPHAFPEFERLLDRSFSPCGYLPEDLEGVPGLSDWITVTDSSRTFVSQISLAEEDKESVYREIDSVPGNVVVDRAYFVSRMVVNTSDNFNFILWVSSLIVFVALFLSYGRLELTVLTFLPMCICWVIILGLMAIFDIRFNIINIILATFIFGIGDDFSIFVMDGLLREYRCGGKILATHKTAIFFSALTTIVGTGVLMFARHPAIRSIALISVIGLCVVVFVSYTVQPFLFKLLISKQVRKGGFPYTFPALLNTAFAFSYFLVGCLLVRAGILLLHLVPIGKERRTDSIHRMVCRFVRLFLKTMFTVRTDRLNPIGEDFRKPAVIIANHQSFIDILVLLSFSPKLVMVTNSWVWNSPFFGRIVRSSGFCHAGDGHEKLLERLSPYVKRGYSVVIFPEGKRSEDCSILRFHKGAFYIASELKLDILSILLYGPGQVSSKRQPFYIKRGRVIGQVLSRRRHDDPAMGESYREQARNYRRYFLAEYRKMEDRYGRADNPYFRDRLLKNYIYKGPVLEWYMKVKARLDGYYDFWDRIALRDGVITDMGCGYGQLAIMLGSLSADRKVIGIDYDRDKIELASRCAMKGDNVSFLCGNMKDVALAASDVFIFNDSLHYVNAEAREAILSRCAASLKENGMIVLRDGDCSRKAAHKAVRKTEVWSTEILKFNRTEEPLEFFTGKWVADFAERNGLLLKVRRCDARTSETIFVLTKRGNGHGTV